MGPVPAENRPALYKIVSPTGECVNNGHGTWPLPTADKPGEWWEVSGEIRACFNGLHLASREQVDGWWKRNTVVFRAEVDGELWDAGDKYVARRVRLLPRQIPGPDFKALVARLKRADALFHRRMRKADKVLGKTLSVVWLNYMDSLGHYAIKHMPEKYVVAYAQRKAAVEEAKRLHNKVILKVNRQFTVARMPD